jgi:hypothetical protein
MISFNRMRPDVPYRAGKFGSWPAKIPNIFHGIWKWDEKEGNK